MERIVSELMLNIIDSLVSGNEIDSAELMEAQKTISCNLTEARIMGKPTEELEADMEILERLNNIMAAI